MCVCVWGGGDKKPVPQRNNGLGRKSELWDMKPSRITTRLGDSYTPWFWWCISVHVELHIYIPLYPPIVTLADIPGYTRSVE